MRSINSALIILLSTLVFSGCNKDKYDEVPHGYYIYEQLGYEWGKTHRGWMIDSDGEVREFDNPSNWNWLDSQGYISEAELRENFAACDNKIKEVSKRKLYRYNKQIPDALEGELAQPEGVSYDALNIGYYCYHYDAKADKYKRVILEVTGRKGYENTSNAAKDIVSWLERINNSR